MRVNPPLPVAAMEMEGREGGKEGEETEVPPPPPPSSFVSDSPPLKSSKHQVEAKAESHEVEEEGRREGGSVAAIPPLPGPVSSSMG